MGKFGICFQTYGGDGCNDRPIAKYALGKKKKKKKKVLFPETSQYMFWGR